MKRSRGLRLVIPVLGTAIGLYFLAAYVIVPMVWRGYADRHPSFDDNPRITQTADGHPGDPLNVALIGGQMDVVNAFKMAGWKRAGALGVRSDLEIAEDTMLSRPDDEAPVSNLFLFGRKEDLAFEQPVGDNPRQRHHVRLWELERRPANGRSLWIGAASYDERVGLSRTTGQVTHHISANVDAERNHVVAGLETAGDLAERYVVEGFHTELHGRNGGGDEWHTDGKLFVGILRLTIDEGSKKQQ